jgi:hypothetical protein
MLRRAEFFGSERSIMRAAKCGTQLNMRLGISVVFE